MFEESRLCDVVPIKLVPIKRNFRVGTKGVSKTPKRFMVAERVMEDADQIKSWVGQGGSSNYLPMLLQR
jgi:hypothetical protein